MRWDHLAPTGPGAVREAHRLLGVALGQLNDLVLADGDNPDSERRLRIASTRVERAARVLETGLAQWVAGQCIHYGEHRYVSTYCQHALATEADEGRSADTEAMHHRCRLACKVCGEACRCPATHCPCTTARNPGNVGG